MERASKLKKRTFHQEKIVFSGKGAKMKNLLLIPFREEGNVFTGGKEKTTCTFILKVFTHLFDQSVKSRQVLL